MHASALPNTHATPCGLKHPIKKMALYIGTQSYGHDTENDMGLNDGKSLR